MQMADIRILYVYNQWANERILAAAGELAPEVFATAALGYCKLHETLVHILSSEWSWRERWQGDSPTTALNAADFPTLAAIHKRWDAEQRQMLALLDTLDDAALHHAISYTNYSGQPFTNTLWHMMTHMVMHGMQHRSELAMLLTELGHSPGPIDLITFVREHA